MKLSHFSMDRNRDESFDVVVVGGGLSGLTAALTITERDKSLSLLVVEQSSKVGGNRNRKRTMVETVSNTNWFLWRLLAKLNLSVVPRKPDGSCFVELCSNQISLSEDKTPIFGSWLEKLRLKYFFAQIEIMTESVSFHSPMNLKNADYLDCISMEEYICNNLNSVMSQNFVRIIVETSCGVKASDISALFYIVYCRSTFGISNQYCNSPTGSAGYILPGGANLICEAISSSSLFDIKFEEQVLAIQRTNHYALVLTTKQLYRCLQVVVAVPPNCVLNISFVPPLPDSRRGFLKSMKLGIQKTMLFAYDSRKWTKLGLSGDFYCAVRSEENVIKKCVNVSSIQADTLQAFVTEYNNSAAKQQLERYFGAHGDVPFDWYVHSFADRKVFMPEIGDLRNFHEIRRPLNRMFWAGSVCAVTWYGHMEGSVQSGVRAGIELLYDYKPQTLSVEDIVSLMKKLPVISVYKDQPLYSFLNNKQYYVKFSVAVLAIVALLYKKLKK